MAKITILLVRCSSISVLLFASLSAYSQVEPEWPSFECQQLRRGTWRQLYLPTRPQGNLHPRYPCDAMSFDYYDRPYNAMDLSNAQRSGVSPDRWSNSILESISIPWEARYSSEGALAPPDGWQKLHDVQPVSARKDKFLEYVDWRQRREARIRWEQSQAELQPNAPQPSDPATTRRMFSPINISN